MSGDLRLGLGNQGVTAFRRDNAHIGLLALGLLGFGPGGVDVGRRRVVLGSGGLLFGRRSRNLALLFARLQLNCRATAGDGRQLVVAGGRTQLLVRQLLSRHAAHLGRARDFRLGCAGQALGTALGDQVLHRRVVSATVFHALRRAGQVGLQEGAGAAQQVLDARALTLGQRLAAQHRQLLVHRLDGTAGEVAVGLGEALDQVVHQLAARGVGQVLGLGARGLIVAGLAHGVGLGLLDPGVLGQHALDLSGLGGVLLGAHGGDQLLHIGLGGRLAFDAGQGVRRALACLVALEHALDLEFVFLLGDRLRRRLRLDQALHAAVVRATINHGGGLICRQIRLQECAGAGQQILNAGALGGVQRLSMEHRQLLVDRLDDRTGEVVVRLRVAFEQMVDQVAARDDGDLPGLGLGGFVLAGDSHGVGVSLGLSGIIGQHALDLGGLGGVAALVGSVDQALHISLGGGVALDVAQRLYRVLAGGAAQGLLQVVGLRGGQAALCGGVLQAGLGYGGLVGRQRALALVDLDVAGFGLLAGQLGLRRAVAQAGFGADQDAGLLGQLLVLGRQAVQGGVDAVIGLASAKLGQQGRLGRRRHAAALIDPGLDDRHRALGADGLWCLRGRGGGSSGLDLPAGLCLAHLRRGQRLQLQARQRAFGDRVLALNRRVRDDGQPERVATFVGRHVAQHRYPIHGRARIHRLQLDVLHPAGGSRLLVQRVALRQRLVAIKLEARLVGPLGQCLVQVDAVALACQFALAVNLVGPLVQLVSRVAHLGRARTVARGGVRVGVNCIRLFSACSGHLSQRQCVVSAELGVSRVEAFDRLRTVGDNRKFGLLALLEALGAQAGSLHGSQLFRQQPAFANRRYRRCRRGNWCGSRGSRRHAEICVGGAAQLGRCGVDRLLGSSHRCVSVQDGLTPLGSNVLALARDEAAHGAGWSATHEACARRVDDVVDAIGAEDLLAGTNALKHGLDAFFRRVAGASRHRAAHRARQSAAR